jgi:hypothetical protein
MDPEWWERFALKVSQKSEDLIDDSTFHMASLMSNGKADISIDFCL